VIPVGARFSDRELGYYVMVQELVVSHGNGGGSSSHALHWFSSKTIQ
jgi:hypothetical protein